MLNGGYIFHDRVPGQSGGRTVLDFYACTHVRATRDEWVRRIAAGLVSREGRVLTAGDLVAEGDHLQYSRPPWDEPDVPLDAPVLYEDPDCLIFHKPAGLPVLPGAGCQDNTLLALAQRRFGPDVRPVHRLDTGTSGAVAFARSTESARHLCQAFATRRVEKTYLARVVGSDLPERFSVAQPIGRVLYPPLGFVSGVAPDGKTASSHIEVLARDPGRNQAIVQVRIDTGRNQQIRIHLAWAGFPLAGDPLYGPGGHPRLPAPGEPPAKPGDGGFLLHAWKLVLPRRDGERWTTVAPPPDGLVAQKG